jgi:hypothetical protein
MIDAPVIQPHGEFLAKKNYFTVARPGLAL